MGAFGSGRGCSARCAEPRLLRETPITCTNDTRPALPDVPAFIESGIPFESNSWLAIMNAPGIPTNVAAKLNQEIATTVREPETQDRLAKLVWS